MTDEDVLFLSDLLPTGYQAAEMGDIERGDTVVVFGCGPVGLFAQLSARLLGARRIIAVDDVEYRLEFARRPRGGAGNFAEGDAVGARLKERTAGPRRDRRTDAGGPAAGGALAHPPLVPTLPPAG